MFSERVVVSESVGWSMSRGLVAFESMREISDSSGVKREKEVGFEDVFGEALARLALEVKRLFQRRELAVPRHMEV